MLTAPLLFFVGLAALLTAEEAGVFLLPGDITLVAAGVYAARGGPPIVMCWIVASIAMVAGSSILFFAVRRSGTSRRALPERARVLIQRHGALGVGLARLVPGFRNMTVFAAAAARLETERFLIGLIPGAVAWTAVLLAAGWLGGDGMVTLFDRVGSHPALRVLSIALVLSAAVFWAVRIRMTVREAEA